MVVKVKNNDLSEAKGKNLAFIDFSAQWCGPCKMLAPVVDELAEELQGEVSFYNVDVDENPALAQQYSIMNIPALVLLKNGEKAGMTVGFQPKEELKAFIEKNK